MISASHSTGRTCAQAPLTCERGFLRPCIVPAKLSYPRQRNVDISCSAQSVSGDLRQGVSGNKRDRLHVIALISEAVSVNAAVQRWETLAGRSAMIGFVVALAAEAAVPVRGLFGAWDQQSLNMFGASATFLIACAAVLASMSTRRVGKKLQGSVLASLTALTTAVEGLDKNVDYIFEEVFSGDFMRDIVTLDMDDFL